MFAPRSSSKALVIDTCCRGFQHADFNSWVLVSLLRISDEVHFYAEKTHIEYIKKTIIRKGYGNYLIRLNSKSVTVNQHSVQDIYKLIADNVSDKYTSISICAGDYYNIKSLFKLKTNTPVYIYMHSIVEEAMRRPSLRPSKFKYILNWFGWILFNPKLRKFNIIFLSKDIYAKITTKIWWLKKNSHFVEFPFLFNINISKVEKKINNKITLGSLGLFDRGKGADEFIKLYDLLANKREQVRYILAGHVHDMGISSTAKKVFLEYYTESPISEQEYELRMKEMDFSVLTFNKNFFKYRTSNAYFESIDNLKSILSLNNSIFNYYEKIFPGTAILKDDIDELAQYITNLSFIDDEFDFKSQMLYNKKLKMIELGFSCVKKIYSKHCFSTNNN